MPSVGMRRNTRVFGARVLRSGRRLWSGPPEWKSKRAPAAASAPNEGEWIDILDSSGDGGGGGGNSGVDDETDCKDNGYRHDDRSTETDLGRNVDRGLVDDSSRVDRMWGSVYQRKRKLIDLKTSNYDVSPRKKRALEDKKYGKQFVRKQRRNKTIRKSSPGPVAGTGRFGLEGSEGVRVLDVVIDTSPRSSTSWFACLLSLIWRYMRRTRLRLLQLSAFFLSESLARVFSVHGIHFLQDSVSPRSRGICRIFGSRSSVPLFLVDFSALPFCFMYLHSTLLLRRPCLPYGCVTYFKVKGYRVKEDRMTEIVEHLPCISSGKDSSRHEAVTPGNGNSGRRNVKEDRMTEIVEHLPCISSGKDSSKCEAVTSCNDNSGRRNGLHPSVGASKLAGRAAQIRNGVNSRVIRKRRRSLRSRRVKKAPIVSGHGVDHDLVPKLVSARHDGELSCVWKNTRLNNKELTSSLVGSRKSLGQMSCSANVLVIECDQCYRIKSANIKMEFSSLKQWFLAIKKDGITLYILTPQKVMRTCSSNRVSHDIIWAQENSNWKLEFPDRREWLIFKELYRECSDRNVRAPSVESVPVPRVHEVSTYADCKIVPFIQPNSYISVNDEELSRALLSRKANYDMDSEDEEWLVKFNTQSSVENEHWEHVSEENFELMIDAFEKASFCCPDDFSDERAAVGLCLDLEQKGVIEAVYSYWMRKRKRKRSALLRVFQCYQPTKRDQLLPKPFLRKKRSFKRQARRSGRGEQQTLWQVMAAAEQAALEEQKALLKVQETKAAASKSESVAVAKRQRAQLLMENADMAAYKAAIALRIAEAARIAQSAEAAVSYFLQ